MTSKDIQKADTKALTPMTANEKDFSLVVRRAQAYAASQLVPQQFQGNVANCIMALELANRLRISELAVMQHLYVVHGKPGWSSTFLIACINDSGKFTSLRFEVVTGEQKNVGGKKLIDRVCIAWALDRETKERLESPPVSMEMAYLEGWATKSGSKWQTMPELMLRYRAATLFARLYAPEITLGFKSADELEDMAPVRATVEQVSPFTRDEDPEEEHRSRPSNTPPQPAEDSPEDEHAPVNERQPGED
jgi:hypothetical protein